VRRELEAAHAENFNITELLYFLLKARMVICDYTSGITRSVGAMLLDGSKIVKNLNMFAEMVRFDQAFRLLMRGNRLAELGLDIQQPRPTVEVALLRLLEINKGCIDITPVNTLLLFSVDKFIGKNEIIGSFTIRKICTVECASAATRTTDMDWAGSYQEALELDYFVKCEAAMLNGGRQPKKLATRLLLCGDVTLATRAQYVVANNEHRGGGPFSTTRQLLAYQNVQLE